MLFLLLIHFYSHRKLNSPKVDIKIPFVTKQNWLSSRRWRHLSLSTIKHWIQRAQFNVSMNFIKLHLKLKSAWMFYLAVIIAPVNKRASVSFFHHYSWQNIRQWNNISCEKNDSDDGGNRLWKIYVMFAAFLLLTDWRRGGRVVKGNIYSLLPHNFYAFKWISFLCAHAWKVWVLSTSCRCSFNSIWKVKQIHHCCKYAEVRGWHEEG